MRRASNVFEEMVRVSRAKGPRSERLAESVLLHEGLFDCKRRYTRETIFFFIILVENWP